MKTLDEVLEILKDRFDPEDIIEYFEPSIEDLVEGLEDFFKSNLDKTIRIIEELE